PMDVVIPSEDSNSQDSVEFNSEAHHGVYPQNSHGYGAQPDSYAMAPMAMNQFDYQVCRCYMMGQTVSSVYFEPVFNFQFVLSLHSMVQLHHSLQLPRDFTLPTGRVLLRTDEIPDRLGLETGPDPLSSSP
ncbi:hypothetical protein XENOCAPTIV_010105, partial [Xenoophorus captivus]